MGLHAEAHHRVVARFGEASQLVLLHEEHRLPRHLEIAEHHPVVVHLAADAPLPKVGLDNVPTVCEGLRLVAVEQFVRRAAFAPGGCQNELKGACVRHCVHDLRRRANLDFNRVLGVHVVFAGDARERRRGVRAARQRQRHASSHEERPFPRCTARGQRGRTENAFFGLPNMVLARAPFSRQPISYISPSPSDECACRMYTDTTVKPCHFVEL
eukprot:scaffold37294_cov55-Phaeocystis_antarctica.AAC.4